LENWPTLLENILVVQKVIGYPDVSSVSADEYIY
jgi:hypothetical protein